MADPCGRTATNLSNRLLDSIERAKDLDSLKEGLRNFARDLARLDLDVKRVNQAQQRAAVRPIIGVCKGGLVPNGKCTVIHSGGTTVVGGAMIADDKQVLNDELIGIMEFEEPYGWQGFLVKECLTAYP